MVLGDQEHILRRLPARSRSTGISIHKLLDDVALFDKLYSEYVRQHDYFG
jgi:hypothetical protein